jgi:dipeptide/tripeptide permease
MDIEEKQRNYELARKLISEQNFTAAVIAGALATVLAAAAYGVTVAKWDFAYGFAAAGTGIVIGLPMGLLGRGVSTKFDVAATLYTIASCILGNVFRVVTELAVATATSPIDVLRSSSLSMLAERSLSSVSLIHLVYWFVAVVCAVFLARRPLSRADRLAIHLFDLRD